jgi:hypothetical protein
MLRESPEISPCNSLGKLDCTTFAEGVSIAPTPRPSGSSPGMNAAMLSEPRTRPTRSTIPMRVTMKPATISVFCWNRLARRSATRDEARMPSVAAVKTTPVLIGRVRAGRSSWCPGALHAADGHAPQRVQACSLRLLRPVPTSVRGDHAALAPRRAPGGRGPRDGRCAHRRHERRERRNDDADPQWAIGVGDRLGQVRPTRPWATVIACGAPPA